MSTTKKRQWNLNAIDWQETLAYTGKGIGAAAWHKHCGDYGSRKPRGGETMGLNKKIGIACLGVAIVFAGILGMLLRIAVEDGKGGSIENTDSVGEYKYSINQDGTATILRYLKKKGKKAVIPSKLNGHPVTAIGKKAFIHRYYLTSIKLPDTVTVIEDYAFSGTSIREAAIPENVVKIGDGAFYGCSNLEWIYISKNVEKIEGNIVCACPMLTKIDVDSRNDSYASVNGILYNKGMTELLAVPAGKDLDGFQLLDSVEHVGDCAFTGCSRSSFTAITIPDRVTVLGERAFAYCSYLERVDIGKGVSKIASDTFLGCDKLSEVAINGKPESIGQYAFSECYDLRKINIPDSVTEIGEKAFYECPFLDIIVPKSVTKIGRLAFGFYYESSEDTALKGYIGGYRGTAAYRYAKENLIAFRDAGTGKEIRFDLVSVPIPRERITVLTAKKGKIELEYYPEEDVSYQIAVREAGTLPWEKYNASNSWTVIKNLKTGKQYQVRVRAWRKIDRKRYYGEWSKMKKVKVQ